MYIIRLQNTSFEASEDSTILDAALRSGVYLEYSCKSGRCSSCKILVNTGDTIALDEETTLSEREKSDGYILSCMRQAASDVELIGEDLREYGLTSSQTIPAKVHSFCKLTNSIIEVKLRIPPSQKISFLEGQYLNVIKGPLKRSYSIANSSSESLITLFIRNYPGGEMSKYWFEEMRVGDLLRIEVALGTFFMRPVQPEDTMVFVGTGTGIAPIKSILDKYMESAQARQLQRVIVLWGMRTSEELFWEPSPSWPGVEYHPCLSREGENPEYVQDKLSELHIDFSSAIVYACGSSEMIKSVNQLTKERGLKSGNFHSDAFVQNSIT